MSAAELGSAAASATALGEREGGGDVLPSSMRELAGGRDALPSPMGDAATIGAGAPVDRLALGTPRRAKSIGHTSYVLKVTLDNGAVGAFKPRSRKPLGDRRYKGEIAAYRLATALGLDNVPRTIARTFRAVDLRGSLSSEGQAEFDTLARADEGGEVPGALTVWIEGYEVLPLETPEWRSRWMPWLTDKHPEIAPSDRAMARAISTLIAFDCMTANWDRWSGGNVARDRVSGTVLYVDNDGAFFDDPPTAAIDRQFKLLRQVVRFSRAFVGALRAVGIEDLRSALGRDEHGAPLLADRNVAAVDGRRQRVLQIIDDAIASEGEAEALVFE
jgi:hypothetical protein